MADWKSAARPLLRIAIAMTIFLFLQVCGITVNPDFHVHSVTVFFSALLSSSVRVAWLYLLMCERSHNGKARLSLSPSPPTSRCVLSACYEAPLFLARRARCRLFQICRHSGHGWSLYGAISDSERGSHVLHNGINGPVFSTLLIFLSFQVSTS